MADNRRILIMDHEPRAGVDMGRVLRSAGYEVLEASTGKDGMSLAREKRPQLILIDEALSDISGIDLVKQIKADAALSRAYVAVLGREGTAPGIQARALESGADALILRTCQTRELLARIEALLRRQASEESLRTSLLDFRATFDAMSDAVYLVNMNYTITDCNLALARFLARPRAEIVGGRCFELVHGAGKPIPTCLGHRVRETRRRESLVVPMEDRWLQVDVDPLLDAANQVIGSVHVVRDITQQRRNEDALQKVQSELDVSAAEHHLALDKASKDLQAAVDARIQAQSVLKSTQAELEQRGLEVENLKRAQRELRTVAPQVADLVYTWDVATGQAHLVSDAQGRFASESGGFPATAAGLQAMIHPAERARVQALQAEHVQKGLPWKTEYRVLQADGQVAQWAVSAAPVVEGAAKEWLAVVRDVTAERRAEQEQETLTAQVQQTQKMDALRRLATGVANEFNRLLAMIVGQVDLLLARIDPSNPLYADLQAIAKVARQGVALIQQLLAFAGREALQPEVLDVNASIEKLKPKLRRAMGTGIELQLALAAQLKPVYADAGVLQDIWLNLAARAAAAMPKGGVLRVDTAGVTLSAADVRIRPLIRAGDYVRVTLTHGGTAVAEEAQQGLFELQLASREPAAGSELGLGVVYGLVQQLGGFIEVAQTAAGETQWAVYLPAHPAAGAVEESAGVAEGGSAASAEPILVGAAPAAEPAVAELVPDAAEPASITSATEPGPAAPVAAEPGPLEPAQQAAAAVGEQTAAPAPEVPVIQEAIVRAPAGDATATEAAAGVPAWLVEEPAKDDISATPAAPTQTPETATGDITEGEATPPPSGLSGLRSRLRNRLGRGRAKRTG